jgi:hypothetical protein
MFVVALVVLVAQLRADPQPSPVVAQAQQLQPNVEHYPAVVGTGFPEPISTIFILGGASAMGLWRLARKFEIV